MQTSVAFCLSNWVGISKLDFFFHWTASLLQRIFVENRWNGFVHSKRVHTNNWWMCLAGCSPECGTYTLIHAASTNTTISFTKSLNFFSIYNRIMLAHITVHKIWVHLTTIVLCGECYFLHYIHAKYLRSICTQLKPLAATRFGEEKKLCAPLHDSCVCTTRSEYVCVCEWALCVYACLC